MAEETREYCFFHLGFLKGVPGWVHICTKRGHAGHKEMWIHTAGTLEEPPVQDCWNLRGAATARMAPAFQSVRELPPEIMGE
jgi:hypothetical protein